MHQQALAHARSGGARPYLHSYACLLGAGPAASAPQDRQQSAQQAARNHEGQPQHSAQPARGGLTAAAASAATAADLVAAAGAIAAARAEATVEAAVHGSGHSQPVQLPGHKAARVPAAGAARKLEAD